MGGRSTANETGGVSSAAGTQLFAVCSNASVSSARKAARGLPVERSNANVRRFDLNRILFRLTF